MIRQAIRWFWAWYERNYALNITIAAALFTLQIVHLIWLTGQPLWSMVFGSPLFEIDPSYSWPLLLVDFTEIPALVTVSLVYVNELRRNGLVMKPVLYLLFLNSQWLHIFWITDEFVLETNSQSPSTVLPVWLAYVAILIDYLELPVIVDTLRKMKNAIAA